MYVKKIFGLDFTLIFIILKRNLNFHEDIQVIVS